MPLLIFPRTSGTIHNRDTLRASLSRDESGTFSRADSSPQRAMKPVIIGIAGGSGSGKTTVARKVAEALMPASVAFIDMDAYYRNHTEMTLDERRHLNWDHP
ncbi:MAG TPA: zeta toxin family protein, partial [Gemmatimonadaceae bacterium]